MTIKITKDNKHNKKNLQKTFENETMLTSKV